MDRHLAARPSPLWNTLLLLALVGCGPLPVVLPDGGLIDEDDAGALDAGPDDAGEVDAGEVDAGEVADAGADEDAGALPDAGDLSDAGVTTDAGAGDSGFFDAGTRGVVLYPTGRLHSPLTSELVDHLRDVATRGARDDDALMKVGDSLTVSSGFLSCFAGSNVDLSGRATLQPTIDAFKATRLGTTTPFDRTSLAATIGWSARSAIAGTPSPVEQELTATNARFATLMFGTNDVGFANPDNYATSMFAIVDLLLSRGVIPVMSSIPPRRDSATANGWVPIYNGVSRALAQARGVPYFDLHQALEPVPNNGITTADNVHLNVFTVSGLARGCLLTTQGLQYGHNVRNLLTLEALTRLRGAVLSSVAPDAAAPTRQGAGTSVDPFVVEALPFVDVRDTRTMGERRIASYSGCSTANEGGPEVLYRFEVTRPMTVRATVAMVGTTADVDVHLLRGSPTGAACVTRHDKTFTAALTPGTYYFSLDTYVSAGRELPGEYALVVLEQ